MKRWIGRPENSSGGTALIVKHRGGEPLSVRWNSRLSSIYRIAITGSGQLSAETTFSGIGRVRALRPHAEFKRGLGSACHLFARAKVHWCAHPCDRVIEHPAKCDTVDVTRMHAESDDTSCEMVHDDQHPVRL